MHTIPIGGVSLSKESILLVDFLKQFEGLMTLNEIGKVAEACFDFKLDDLHNIYACRQIIVNILMAYKLGKVSTSSKSACEKDVIHRLWRNLDIFFED